MINNKLNVSIFNQRFTPNLLVHVSDTTAVSRVSQEMKLWESSSCGVEVLES